MREERHSLFSAAARILIVIFLCNMPVFSAQNRKVQPIDADCPDGFLKCIKIVTDRALDCSSLKRIVDTATRGCRTNDEKAIAIYNAARLLWYHHQYPGEPGGVAALKMVNVYGWSLCGGQHTVLAALWRAAGWGWRYVGWRGHTTVECRYDGRWHYFDTFLKVYAFKPDPNSPGGRTVASQADIKADPDLINKQFVYDNARKVWYGNNNRFELINDRANWVAPAFFVCGDQPQGVVNGVKTTSVGGTSNKFGHAGIKFAEDGYNTNVNLAPGYSLELMWKSIEGAHWFNGRKYTPHHTCGDKDYRNCPAIGPVLEPYRYLNERGARTFSNGILRFTPDLGDSSFLSALAAKENVKWSKGRIAPADASRPASITICFQSPYIMTRGKGRVHSCDSAEISLDRGKSFKRIDLESFDDEVGGRYACFLKLTFSRPVTSLEIEIIVQHNRCALPYLSPGKNTVTVSAVDPSALGAGRLVVTYAYCPGMRHASYEDLCGQGAELARAHNASWTDTPAVVQKIFKAGDLPATFEIPVPTPEEKHPVYPRMLFLRREVVAPGQAPLPLLENAVTVEAAKGGQLKTLPDPFKMGIAKPPKRVVRPTVTREIPLAFSHVVWRDGKGVMRDDVWRDHFIKTRPRSQEAWVMLIAGELKNLPGPRDIASARLCVPITNATPQAPTMIGAALLQKPFESMRSYNLKNAGGIVGSAVVPKYPKSAETKYYKLDITRAVKQIAAGAPFHGLALQTVPNRSIDDGWTTRIDVAREKRIYVELEVYVKR